MKKIGEIRNKFDKNRYFFLKVIKSEKGMKKWTGHFTCIIFLIMIFLPLNRELHAFPLTPERIEKSGTFSLYNTTESLFLASAGNINRIGETWNLTVDLLANSSTRIDISYSNPVIRTYKNVENWWEGPKQFSVDPGQKATEKYVSHITADFMTGIGFYIRLNNSIEYAQGTYQLIMIFPGYLFDVGTSHLYVADIAAWRKAKSEELPRLILTVTVLVLLPSVSLIILRRRRQKKRTAIQEI
ncbi:hypothetical protein CEE45_16660 [Candidatus Heimdallarchaeota archaeon B3_Heim]|nr:MAG: hypothetical protein CEE45_16660 [Candidatus Heimdallarchaeota archaeon B3_Heim]